MKARTSNSFGQRGSRSGPPTAGPNGGQHDLQLLRHQAQCLICRHPLREAVEQDFLDWICPRKLAQTYKFTSERAIYRHAHALELIEPRRANRLAALDRIIERVGEVKLTAAAVISAIRLSAQLAREAAASGPSRKGIVLSFAGMPASDAVLPRHDAEKQNRLSSGESAPPEDGSPCNHANSGKRPSLPAEAGRDRQACPPRRGADGLGHQRQHTEPRVMSQVEPSQGVYPERSRGEGQPFATQARSESGVPKQNAVVEKPDWPQVAGRIWPWPPRKKIFFPRAHSSPAEPSP